MGYRCHVTEKYDIQWSDSIECNLEILKKIYDKVYNKELFMIADLNECSDMYEIEYTSFVEFIKKKDYSIFSDEERKILVNIYEKIKDKEDNFNTGWFKVEFF